ncbi:fluoride efflux transporter CrcB [Ancylobacter defluvii]|uniref:Fluoride-specific ion channel FluC n=1 Tax=Ancylobacter defluvii TaxID=1282440 RepID=A0A9W6JW09_9HYPH|nr:fluoride efflux transporter CrcB [Ancylobacter defluvii]MBS7589229.1 fluoride efflux transporter CrcB [Ancylobacter defluvii]GLK84841.1 hypothetical protein GCM10017653_29110 [Ancylobacter defluvii]
MTPPSTLPALAAVFLGGGAGSVMRYLVGRFGTTLTGPSFPAATLAINVSGSLLMGILAGWLMAHPRIGPTVGLLLTTGMMGGYTTYSTFALDTAMLVNRGSSSLAAFYVAGTLAGGLAGVFGGLGLARLA